MKRFINNFIIVIATVLVFSSVGPTFANAKVVEEQNIISSSKEIIDNSNINPKLGLKDKEAIKYLENIKVNIIEDNENFRIVETTENEQTIVTTLNKNTNIITSQVKGDDTSEIEVDLNELAKLEESYKESTSGGVSTLASTLKQDTFSNYEYTITFSSPEKWQLRRPNPDNILKWYYKDVTKTTKNSTNLSNFKKSVDDLNYYELMFIGSASGVAILTIVSFIVASISGGAGFAGLLVAAGVTGAAYNYAMQMNRAANNAHYYYFQV